MENHEYLWTTKKDNWVLVNADCVEDKTTGCKSGRYF